MGDTTPPRSPPAFFLTDKDKQILSMRDEDYKLHTWDDLKEIISHNQLDKLTRLPSQLRLYLAWSAETKTEYGNMTNFILHNRVCWVPSTFDELGSPVFAPASPIPFASSSDYRILLNDWPYGLAPGITHVVIWLKVRLPIDAEGGDLTVEGRRVVNAFVEREVRERLGLGRDEVMWFKNWAGLQSVRGVEHVHVLVRGVERDVLDEILERPWEAGS